VIGACAGLICYTAVMMKSRFGYDDSLDVVGVHGVGGIFGALATGIFASKAINPSGADGLIYGNWNTFQNQLIAVGATVAFAAVGTGIILFALKGLMGLRVTENEERLGLDLSQHNESAYALNPDYDESEVPVAAVHAVAYKTATEEP
jgi:Amt family ammonium transporter